MKEPSDNLEELVQREKAVSDTELPCRISLFQALPEGKKMDGIISKAVELGVYEIIPMETRRSDRLSDAEKKTMIRHWNETASSEAAHDSRTFIPQVKPVLSFSDAILAASGFDRKLIPYEMERGMKRTREIFDQIRPGDSVCVLIGPEKGFSPEEADLAKDAGIVPISLGHRILRTETAGMCVLSILMFLLEQE